jgi:hypothetical protein
LRPRVLFYAGGLLLSVIALAVLLGRNSGFRMEVLRAPGLPFQLREENGKKLVQNHFTLRLENESKQEMTVHVQLDKEEYKMVLPENPVVLKKESRKDLPLFVEEIWEVGDQAPEKNRIEVLVTTVSDGKSRLYRQKINMVNPK